MDIIVKGTGKAAHKATVVNVTADYKIGEDTYEKALENGTSEINNFVEFVSEIFKIKKEDIKTLHFGVSEKTEYDEQLQKNINSGYNYNHSVSLTVNCDMDKVAEFVEAMTDSADKIKYRVVFDIKEDELVKARREAMDNAYKKAQEKAQLIAKAAGKKLKKCLKVDFQPFEEEITPSSNIGNQENRRMSSKEPGMFIKGPKQASMKDVFMPRDLEIFETLYCLWQAE